MHINADSDKGRPVDVNALIYAKEQKWKLNKLKRSEKTFV